MRVVFIDKAGVARAVTGEPGQNAMRCAKANQILGILGECGGSMACGTCHGYVDDAWVDKVRSPTSLERDILQGCIARRDNSRLTCQIILSDGLDGLTIQVADAQT